MEKSPKAFRTISEVADVLGVPPHVLRFWESKFSQIKPVKRGGGRRYYRPDDVALIRGIQCLLYEDGMTIKGAQKMLRKRGVKAIAAMGAQLLDGGAVPTDDMSPATHTPPAPQMPSAPVATGPSGTKLAALRDLYARLMRLRENMVAEIRG